jgi:hypothetical protein
MVKSGSELIQVPEKRIVPKIMRFFLLHRHGVRTGGLFKEGLSYIQKVRTLDVDNPKYKELEKRLTTHK